MSRLLASRLLAREWWTDARHYQIAALSTSLIFNFGWLDFGARPLNSALAIGSALATQAICTRAFALPHFDPRSPLITGLSLSLLLRADEAWLHALAGLIGIGSKFVLRVDGKHIFNPAAIAVVITFFIYPDSIVFPCQVKNQCRKGGRHIVQPFSVAFLYKCLAHSKWFIGAR